MGERKGWLEGYKEGDLHSSLGEVKGCFEGYEKGDLHNSLGFGKANGALLLSEVKSVSERSIVKSSSGMKSS